MENDIKTLNNVVIGPLMLYLVHVWYMVGTLCIPQHKMCQNAMLEHYIINAVNLSMALNHKDDMQLYDRDKK